MKNFISLGISGIGLALILSGAQAMTNEGFIGSETHTALHTLNELSMDEHMAPIPMTDEQLNAVEGKQNLSGGNLRQEIRTSTQAIINENLSQLLNMSQPGQSPIGSGERLAQEIRISTQEIINQNLNNLGGPIP